MTPLLFELYLELGKSSSFRLFVQPCSSYSLNESCYVDFREFAALREFAHILQLAMTAAQITPIGCKDRCAKLLVLRTFSSTP